MVAGPPAMTNMAEHHLLQGELEIGKLPIALDECLACGRERRLFRRRQPAEDWQGELGEEKPGVRGEPGKMRQQLAHEGEGFISGVRSDDGGLAVGDSLMLLG